MNNKFEEPEYEKEGFTCPNCSAFTQHTWDYIRVSADGCFGYGGNKLLASCRCTMCDYISFWYEKELIWPLNVNVQSANQDMPEDIKKLYDEARSIIELSPKGSCALLRLGLQKLCSQLAGTSESTKLDHSIAKLVENGLPASLQQAMDTVRIVGNEAVHPGEINVDDNKEIAYMMFNLMNFIVEKMIVEPKTIAGIYNTMPSDKLKAIDNRKKQTPKHNDNKNK